MDGLIRSSTTTLGLDQASRQRRREAAFRAWHRQPDAMPEPIGRQISHADSARRTALMALLWRVVVGRQAA